jgi:hypothetical protein
MNILILGWWACIEEWFKYIIVSLVCCDMFYIVYVVGYCNQDDEYQFMFQYCGIVMFCPNFMDFKYYYQISMLYYCVTCHAAYTWAIHVQKLTILFFQSHKLDSHVWFFWFYLCPSMQLVLSVISDCVCITFSLHKNFGSIFLYIDSLSWVFIGLNLWTEWFWGWW